MSKEPSRARTIFRVQAEEQGCLRPVLSAGTTWGPALSGPSRRACLCPLTPTRDMEGWAEVPGMPPSSRFSLVVCAQVHTLVAGGPLQMGGDCGFVPLKVAVVLGAEAGSGPGLAGSDEETDV